MLTPCVIFFSHSEARAVFVDGEFADKVKAALDGLDKKPLVIDIVDSQSGDANPTIGECDYEYFINTAAEPLDSHPADEWEPLALNYTSGTTGEPKGVVYHHRGSYLMSFGSAIAWNMKPHGVYLYTVPMFHCKRLGLCLDASATGRHTHLHSQSRPGSDFPFN